MSVCAVRPVNIITKASKARGSDSPGEIQTTFTVTVNVTTDHHTLGSASPVEVQVMPHWLFLCIEMAPTNMTKVRIDSSSFK